MAGSERSAAARRHSHVRMHTTLEAYGPKLGDVAERTIMLADTGEWQMFNEVYKGFFEPPYPVRSPLGINGLALGGRVELECMAVFAS
ncbi:hypothetical protein JJQ59_35330 (plasmid) [Cupriavidus necator]|uniref:Uncharacterized protein n=2 Tax=Cupriavidus necator TaxID=106590 RepID=A0A367PKA6_CUPNE|nr:Rid family hydrolase [Cupriavidus necator]QQX89931.1 hypothetical protein JJQ59_35330 [Cupriavidus necator]RCJ08342.1 hypothetical protein DDK22_11280 [Cupriavidus necator]